MPQLIPTLTVDRNGRITTVYKRDTTAKRGLGNLFGVLPRSSEPSRAELFSAITDRICEWADESFVRQYRSFIPKTSTKNLQGVLSVLQDERSSLETLSVLVERAESSDKQDFNEWLESFAAHYGEMKEWRSGHQMPPDDSMIARLLAGVLSSAKKESSFGYESELSVARLTHALSGTGIGGGFMHRPTPYGLAFYSGSEALREFVVNHHGDKELMDTAAALIAGKKVNRIEDLEDVASGDLPTVFAEGAL